MASLPSGFLPACLFEMSTALGDLHDALAVRDVDVRRADCNAGGKGESFHRHVGGSLGVLCEFLHGVGVGLTRPLSGVLTLAAREVDVIAVTVGVKCHFG